MRQALALQVTQRATRTSLRLHPKVFPGIRSRAFLSSLSSSQEAPLLAAISCFRAGSSQHSSELRSHLHPAIPGVAAISQRKTHRDIPCFWHVEELIFCLVFI